MQRIHRIYSFVLGSISLMLLVALAPAAKAQVVGEVNATLTHPFIVGNTTLPPGKYDFRMEPGTDLTVLTVDNANNNIAVDALVRNSIDSHTPKHTELVFDRYGNKEFLKDVYESGDKAGVAVVEPSREEAWLQKQGQKPLHHTEELEH